MNQNNLIQNSYGKSGVRLTRIIRGKEKHELKEVTVAIDLQGDFAETYLTGDNSKVVATDTMKNTVYALARQHSLESVEEFGLHLADHFIQSYPQVAKAEVRLVEDSWNRIQLDGKGHPNTFVGGSNEKRTTTIVSQRDSTSEVRSGLKDLLVLKTTDSAFVGFPRDRYTTLPEVDDRILATVVTAEWLYQESGCDWNACFHAIRESMLRIFAEHHSLSVQQTLHLMGGGALEACASVSEISLQLPNAHRLLVNLEPMGMDNPNEVFVPTDEPYGLITGTLRREGDQ